MEKLGRESQRQRNGRRLLNHKPHNTRAEARAAKAISKHQDRQLNSNNRKLQRTTNKSRLKEVGILLNPNKRFKMTLGNLNIINSKGKPNKSITRVK